MKSRHLAWDSRSGGERFGSGICAAHGTVKSVTRRMPSYAVGSFRNEWSVSPRQPAIALTLSTAVHSNVVGGRKGIRVDYQRSEQEKRPPKRPLRREVTAG